MNKDDIYIPKLFRKENVKASIRKNQRKGQPNIIRYRYIKTNVNKKLIITALAGVITGCIITLLFIVQTPDTAGIILLKLNKIIHT